MNDGKSEYIDSVEQSGNELRSRGAENEDEWREKIFAGDRPIILQYDQQTRESERK